MKMIKLLYILLPFFLVSCVHKDYNVRGYPSSQYVATAEGVQPRGSWQNGKFIYTGEGEQPRGYWLSGTFIPEQKPGALNDFFGDKDVLLNTILVIGAIDKNR